jgi:hypothetical protein
MDCELYSFSSFIVDKLWNGYGDLINKTMNVFKEWSRLKESDLMWLKITTFVQVKIFVLRHMNGNTIKQWR